MENKNLTKVAIVMPVWSPMRHRLFESIAKFPGVRLKVFFEKERIRPWASWSPVPNTAYEWDIIDSYHPGFLKRFRLIPYRLPISLRHFKPDVVIVVCLTQAVFALPALRGRTHKVILWTGESEHILARRFAPRVLKLIRRAMYPLIDGFGCYSKATLEFLNQAFAAPSFKLFQIPQCVDISHFKMPDDRSLKDLRFSSGGKHVFLAVGRLAPEKGYKLLIRAWSKLPAGVVGNCLLRIAGKGPLRENLEEQVRKAGLDSVEFVGFVEYKNLPLLYRDADVFILPSLEDTWGFVVNEAMASGLPVLCSKYAHAREMVNEGENGYIFDPLAAGDITSHILSLYKRRAEWKNMGKFGRETVEKLYPAEVAAEALLNGINRILRVNR
ncbi:MAG: glycosyltransferase family 4 protein [Nitrospinales bacterium]